MMLENDRQKKEEQLMEMCDLVKEICMPLFMFLTIRFFRLVRSYPDGSKFILCSNWFWLKQYFDNAFYNLELATYQKLPDNSEGISLHGACDSSNPVCAFWNRLGPYCEYNNLLSMYKKTDDYLDLFDFGLGNDTHVAQNIFLNNQTILQHFINYFYQEAKPLMQKAYDCRFQIDIPEDFDKKNNWLLGLEDEYESKILKKMPLKEIYLGDNLTASAICAREGKIILLLAKGYNKKQISDQLQISEVDLKNDIESILEKLNVSSEADIKKAIFKMKLLSKLMLF